MTESKRERERELVKRLRSEAQQLNPISSASACADTIESIHQSEDEWRERWKEKDAEVQELRARLDTALAFAQIGFDDEPWAYGSCREIVKLCAETEHGPDCSCRGCMIVRATEIAECVSCGICTDRCELAQAIRDMPDEVTDAEPHGSDALPEGGK